MQKIIRETSYVEIQSSPWSPWKRTPALVLAPFYGDHGNQWRERKSEEGIWIVSRVTSTRDKNKEKYGKRNGKGKVSWDEVYFDAV